MDVGNLCEEDSGDLCGADGGDLSEEPVPKCHRFYPALAKLPLHPICSSYTCSIPAEGEKLHASPGKLVVCPEEDDSDLCMTNSGELATADSPNSKAHFSNATGFTRFPEPQSPFPELHSFYQALAKLPKQRRLSCSLLRPSWRQKSWSLLKKKRLISWVLHRCNVKGVVSHTSCKSSKCSCSRTMHRVYSRTSCCNLAGEALHVGASSVALQPPVPDISEITDRHTDTHTKYGY